MKYYHITSLEDLRGILKTGLNGTVEGQIFVMTDKRCAPSIAVTQCGYEDYVLLEINSKGITGKIEMDNVAELTAKWQRIIYQKVIDPKYIRPLGIYKVSISKYYENLIKQLTGKDIKYEN